MRRKPVWRIGFSFYLKLSEIAKCGLRRSVRIVHTWFIHC